METRRLSVAFPPRNSTKEAFPADVLKVMVVKEEQQEDPQPARGKNEDNQPTWTRFSSTGVHVKGEDGDYFPETQDKRQAATESDGDRSGGSETDPLSHVGASASCDTDDSDGTNEPPTSSRPAKKFDCSECDKSFEHKRNLKRHMRRHTGEKPFSCSVCGKTFRQRSNLVVHARTHTGVKPFACQLCHTSFSQRISLVLHGRTHTGEKPFPCSLCGERFSRKATVMSHMRTHTGEKPFGCDTCDRRFAFKCQVTKHKCGGK
ncbi:gastrula zinc finger protein XlCGF49.1-like [Nerophis ophidion]|uniref:gastrula zinc finger protein XlCGF49.1-like n=1 Tax=Nerophis ophidion TaxID=159077 RepID=UPI002ADF44CC|nr:gastrula zinc finger protein XlCGF49.1-like [Nerophis ophidion]